MLVEEELKEDAIQSKAKFYNVIFNFYSNRESAKLEPV